MAICLVQIREEKNPFFITVSASRGMQSSLSGMDYWMLDRIIWVLKRYPLMPNISNVIVAVTDFNQINFHISDYENIPDEPFLAMSIKDLMGLSYGEIVVLVSKKTPKL